MQPSSSRRAPPWFTLCFQALQQHLDRDAGGARNEAGARLERLAVGLDCSQTAEGLTGQPRESSYDPRDMPRHAPVMIHPVLILRTSTLSASAPFVIVIVVAYVVPTCGAACKQGRVGRRSLSIEELVCASSSCVRVSSCATTHRELCNDSSTLSTQQGSLSVGGGMVVEMDAIKALQGAAMVERVDAVPGASAARAGRAPTQQKAAPSTSVAQPAAVSSYSR